MTDRETIQRLQQYQSDIAQMQKQLRREKRFRAIISFVIFTLICLVIHAMRHELFDSPEHRLNWTAETHTGCRVDWISDLRVCHWALPDGTTVDTRSM